jgi:hypothetical protein
MDRLDRSFDEVRFGHAWRSATGRLAVASGCLVALLSLFQHVPPTVASLRGGAAWISVLLVARLGRSALLLAENVDRAAAERAAAAGESEEQI